MQKNVPGSAPDWIPTVRIWAEASKRDVRYALCNDVRTLTWFANQRAVEYHPQLFRVDTPARVTHMEGHTIPVARVQAMHEGKRRKRAREAAGEG